MRKPRICFVNPPVLLKRPISEIIYTLNKKGYNTSLLIPKKLFRKRDASLHHSQLVRGSKIYTYSIINPPFINAEQPLPATPMFCINVFKAMKNNDIIHLWVPYYLTSLKIILTKRLFFPDKKMILTMDTVPGYSFSMGKLWDRAFRIYNWIFRSVLFGTPNIVTLYGKSMMPFALKAGVSEQKIRIIPTGIDIKKLQKNKSESEIRKELELDKETMIVTYAGLIIPRKGIDKIIKIASKMIKDKVVFVLAGDGPGRKEYEKQVKELGLEKKIFFLGWRKDMEQIYQSTDIVLLPAEGEGLPGLIMEAMSYGVPCVASNIPCIPDLIKNGETGFLCNKDRINDFVQRIDLLMKKKELRKSMGEKAKKSIAQFEWGRIISNYISLYHELHELKELNKLKELKNEKRAA